MANPTCRYCFHAELRSSRSRGFADRVMKLFGRRPMRCPGCNRRTYVPRNPKEKTRDVVAGS